MRPVVTSKEGKVTGKEGKATSKEVKAASKESNSSNRIVYALIFGILTSFAFLSPTIIPEPQHVSLLSDIPLRFMYIINNSLAQGLVGTIFAAFFAAFYYHRLSTYQRISTDIRYKVLFFSLALSLALIIGESFRVYDGFGFIAANAFQILLSVILLAGYTVFFYTITEIALLYFDKITDKTTNIKSFPFLISMAILMLCWLPIWLIYMPGTITWDGGYQISQFLGLVPWSDHHPIFITIIYGLLFSLGRLLGSDNLGVFLIVLFQSTLLAASFAFALLKAKKWGVPAKARFFMLLFWALNPVFAFQLVAVLKDNPSTVVLVFFTVFYVDFIRANNKMNLMAVILLGVLASLIRHNNIYIAVISIMLLALLKQSASKRIITIAAAVICFVATNLISGIFINALNAERGDITEALSIPFQQTARFIRDHPDQVQPEERAAIDAVLRFDDLVDVYTPYFSDPVRNTSRGNTQVLPEYFKYWLNMGLRQPITYIEATIANSQSYFLPVKYRVDHEWIHMHAWVHHSYEFFDTYNIPIFNIVNTHERPQREAAAFLYSAIRRLPGVNLFFHLSHYTWFLLFLVLLLVKNKGDIIAFAPAFLVILSCMASPVDGHVRYFLPVIAITPLLTVWSIYTNE